MREVGEIAPSARGQGRADLEARDAKAAAGKWNRRLAGSATDLQEPITHSEPCGLHQRLVKLLGIVGASLLIQVGRRLERRSQLLSVAGHAPMIARMTRWRPVLVDVPRDVANGLR